MIKINRPALIPARLTGEGATADQQNRDDYDDNPLPYINLVTEFNILNTIYGHKTVKDVLRNAQHGKCCFCEKDQREEDGSVEHFRPKMGFKQTRKDKLEKPGYFWLGYTWTNLLFCCKKCNGAGCKGNLFPLAQGSTRSRSHNDNLALEIPELIDPASIDPSLHLFFRDEFIHARTTLGRETIKILRLDRTDLNDFRKEHIAVLKLLIVAVQTGSGLSPGDIQQAKDYLLEAKADHSKFSAAARQFIEDSGVDLS